MTGVAQTGGEGMVLQGFLRTVDLLLPWAMCSSP